MADVRTVTQQLANSPVTKENSVAFIERELKPLLRQTRAAINEFMPAPRIPRFGSSPVTDADFEALRITAEDGMLSFSAPSLSGDGSLYVRDGSATHVKVI